MSRDTQQMQAMRAKSSWKRSHAAIVPPRLRGKLASPWNHDHAIPPDRAVGSLLPLTHFATSHRDVLKQHALEPSTCIIYDASGQPREAMDKLTRERKALT